MTLFIATENSARDNRGEGPLTVPRSRGGVNQTLHSTGVGFVLPREDAAMPLSRTELDAELAKLEARIPYFIGNEEPECVMEAFAGEAAVIAEHAGTGVAYVRCRLNDMLASAGLIPSDQYD